MSIIIGLVILGVVLIGFEIIVPGGILGLFGGISMLGACALTYKDYGVFPAVGLFIVCLFLALIEVITFFKVIPNTKIGKQLFLNKTVDEKSTHSLGDENIIGKKGITLTTLAPTGIVLIDDNEFEAFSKDGLIPKDQNVKVVGRDNFRILVKQDKEN